MFTLFGFLCFVCIGGAVLLDYSISHVATLAAFGSMAIITGLAFLADCVFLFFNFMKNNKSGMTNLVSRRHSGPNMANQTRNPGLVRANSGVVGPGY